MNQHKHTNHLFSETSPYLLQHAHNPVNWFAWGDEALQLAKTEDKPILISIGYSACHWCHVMERESFEDEETAVLMNRYFINIKVDREERPDLDHIYMDAVQAISGSGGWPLNVFLTPEGKPFYGGTYFPPVRAYNRSSWKEVLEAIHNAFTEKRADIELQAGNLVQHIITANAIGSSKSGKLPDFSLFEIAVPENITENLLKNADTIWGGFGGAPKFPQTFSIQYLLRQYYFTGNENAVRQALLSLDKMIQGGIYDQLGGGFARYSTDKEWLAPHFEKMLYDNAQLVSLYAHAFQLTKNPLYKTVVYETLDFVTRELMSSEGGFYSSLDADSEGEEGKFYIWEKLTIEKVLDNGAELFIDYYNIRSSGNWEDGKNILCRNETDESVSKKYNISLDELKIKISEAKKKLFQHRNSRVRPALDDKMLTSWNALMLKGLTIAYRAFGDEKFLKIALKNANFLMQKAIKSDGEIYRNYKDGKSSIHGMLDDYAFTASAFIELYQATFDDKWIMAANKIVDYTLIHFFDNVSGMFFYTHHEHSNLISRKMEVTDNVIPSSNSEMAKNLFVLGKYFFNDEYINKARQMLLNVKADMQKNIFYYSNWGMLEIALIAALADVAIVGNNCFELRCKLDENYLPNALLSGGQHEGRLPVLENKHVDGKTSIYVCRNKVCKIPVTEVDKALFEILE